MSRVVDEWIEEATWTCTNCKTENEGHRMTCKECGDDKDKREQDKVADSTGHRVTDPEMLKLANAGPHWECKQCGAQQRSFIKQCYRCGKYQDEDKLQMPTYSKDDAPSTIRLVHSLSKLRPPPRPERNWFGWALFLGGLAAIMAFIWALMPHATHAHVSVTDWRTTTTVQHRYVEHDSGWGSPLLGVFNVQCESRISDYKDCNPKKCNPHVVPKRVKCGERAGACTNRCKPLANGFKKCQRVCDDPTSIYCDKPEKVFDTCYDKCPSYDRWCEYDEYVWRTVHQDMKSGTVPPVTWPSSAPLGSLDDDRVLNDATYHVGFVNGKKSWDYKPNSLVDFQRFRVGDVWTASVSAIGGITPEAKVTTH